MLKRKSSVCCVKNNHVNCNLQDTVEESKPMFKIWKEKMERSGLFFPSEVHNILAVWMEFTRQRIHCLPKADAFDFYCATAEFAASKLKQFSKYGWDCLIMEFRYEELQCIEELLVQPSQSVLTKLSSTSLVDSTQDFVKQFEFLLQLVASSNFNLHLVKIAVDQSFEPTRIAKKSSKVIMLPKKYLNVENCGTPQEKTRKHLLNGALDKYILPLQLANEINEDFWDQVQREIDTEQTQTK